MAVTDGSLSADAGMTLILKKNFRRFSGQQRTFPKSMLYPAIADKVWIALARGDLADAVFIAYRSVEEAVRKAGGYGDAEIGVDLMRKAFDPKGGPLSDPNSRKKANEKHLHTCSPGQLDRTKIRIRTGR